MKRRREIRDLRTHPLKNDRFRPWSLPTAHRSALLDSAQPFPLHEVPMRVIGLAVVLVLSLTLVPLVGEAQQDRIARIGFLDQFSGPLPNLLSAFRESMGELGYVEDRNLAIDYRFAEGKTDRLPELAAELIGLRVDVIIALGPAALEAAKARTATVPIVASDLESDPVAAGFVASLARPGGNITGTFLDQAAISGKWLELLKTAISKLSRVAVLWDSTTPSHQLNAIKMGAQALAVTLQTLAVRVPEDFQDAFAAAARQHAQGMVMLSSPLVLRA